MKFWFSFFLFFNCYLAQVAGLDGWDLFIDPGHSQDENMGINGLSNIDISFFCTTLVFGDI